MPTRDYKQESLAHFNNIAGRYDSHRYGRQTRKVHKEVVRIIDELRRRCCSMSAAATAAF